VLQGRPEAALRWSALASQLSARMLGSMKPVVFNPYGRRRSRWRPPRWLVLVVVGMAVGAAGVVLVQERYLPPRLSAADSAALRADFAQADSERVRLRRELESTAKRLDAALAEKKALADDLGATRQSVERLRGDVASLAGALPADPRGGAVQVRAAQFRTEGGKLFFDVILSRDRAAGKTMQGVLQLIVAGAPKGKPETTVRLAPVPVAIGSVESVRGGVPLPDGFDPRQATIHVLDRPDGKLLGMRVINVR
jgi:hypothetical protein